MSFCYSCIQKLSNVVENISLRIDNVKTDISFILSKIINPEIFPKVNEQIVFINVFLNLENRLFFEVSKEHFSES